MMTRMKKSAGTWLALVLAACLLGCTTTNSDGDRVFDPVGTRAVLAPMEPVIGEAVRYASNQDPNTRNAFQIAEAELGALLGEVDVDREAVFERLKAIRVRGVTLEESERIVRVASNVVLSYWRLLYETALAPEIGKSEAARLVLSSIREGIRQGLRD